MKIYLSIGGNKKVWSFVRELGLGWCIAPDKVMNPQEVPYFLDNGAFHAWRHKQPWSENRFKILVKKLPDYDFVVLPDIVCGGEKSLLKSLKYVGEIHGPVYLAVQDGMTMQSVRYHLDGIDGIFVGGSINWKFSTARMWADLAHLYGKKCHAGRVGTWEGMIHMHFCGVDSVDSSTASRHSDDSHIRKYLDHLVSQTQLEGATA